MKKILSLIFLPLLVMALVASPASAWGPATHAYIGKERGRKFGYLNLQEMYGAMAPDFPWVMFDLPQEIRDHLGELTHYEYMNVVYEARRRTQKAFAYGFATHNEEWGADYWAHIDPGYTKNQAGILMSKWYPDGFDSAEEFWNYVEGLGKSPGFAAFVSDVAIEYGIDILIKQNENPEIGLRVLGSASVRSWSIPWLLVRAYAEPLAEYAEIEYFKAAKIIIAGEKELKRLLIRYGTALSQEDPVDAVAEIAATQFSYLIKTPAPTTADLKKLASVLLKAAMDLCEPDYSTVLGYTIMDVAPEDHGIPYPYLFLGASDGYGFDK